MTPLPQTAAPQVPPQVFSVKEPLQSATQLEPLHAYFWQSFGQFAHVSPAPESQVPLLLQTGADSQRLPEEEQPSEGGPLEHVVAAKAVAFREAMQPEFRAEAGVDSLRAELGKLALGGLLLALLESVIAKMRVFRVAEFLGIALMLGALGTLLLFFSRSL